MSWVDAFEFEEPFVDLRSESATAQLHGAELDRELGPTHPLFGRRWTVVAQALPQDEVIVTDGESVALVHLTWTGTSESPPWPTFDRIDTLELFREVTDSRH